MRQIKFRAWDSAKRKMLNNVGYHPNVCMIHDGYIGDEDGAFTISPAFFNYTLMQYTGINDKNGMEVYEDDALLLEGGEIVRVRIKPFNKISSGHGCCEFTAGFSFFSGYGRDSGDIEVIGNIHETPELLK